MELNNFAFTRIPIKSSWFEKSNNSVFKQIGKDEGLNLYLNLFRFRQHQMFGEKAGNNHHIFRVTIGELQQYTKLNRDRKLSPKQIVDLLKKMCKANVLHNHSFSDWSKLKNDKGKFDRNRVIVFEATDVPQFYKDENNVYRRKTDDDYYILVNFEMMNWLINECELHTEDISLYLLIVKLSVGHKVAFPSIEKIKNYLGRGGDGVIDSLIKLNKVGAIATFINKSKNGDSYKHEPKIEMDQGRRESFGDIHFNSRKRFLERYDITLEDNMSEGVENDDFTNVVEINSLPEYAVVDEDEEEKMNPAEKMFAEQLEARQLKSSKNEDNWNPFDDELSDEWGELDSSHEKFDDELSKLLG